MAKSRAMETSRLLLHEEPLQVLPSLAVAIGLHEAMMLQQMHYWLRRRCHARDGRQWIYNRYEDWRDQFPFWSISTIKRAIYALERLGVIVSANYNNSNIDKTKWYSINYEKLNELCAVSTGQDEPSTGQDEPSTGQDEPSTGQDEPSTGQDEPSSGSGWSIGSIDARAFGQETTQETTDREKENSLPTVESYPGGGNGISTPGLLTPRAKSATPLSEDDWPGLRALLASFDFPLVALDDNNWWNAVSHACNGLDMALLDREFGKIEAYLTENPRKRPTPKGWKRFLRTWLERANEYERRHHGLSQKTRR